MKRYIQSAVVNLADEDRFTKGHIASDPTTRPDILAQLANSNDWWIRESVARNPNISQATLEQLANDPSPSVRAEVIKNPSASKEFRAKVADSLSNKSDDAEYTFYLYGISNDPNGPDVIKVIDDIKQFLSRRNIRYKFVEFRQDDPANDSEVDRMFDVHCLDIFGGDEKGYATGKLIRNFLDSRGYDVTDWTYSRQLA